MMKAIISFFKRVLHPPKKLTWILQTANYHMRDYDGRWVHFSRTEFGVFEIYDDLSGEYLLVYPKGLKLPAELFHCLDEAKFRACEVYND
jgi:hypothetical protein